MTMPNNYKNSYGLVVIVKNELVVLIKRNFPYVFQQYLMDKKNNCNINDFIENYLAKQDSAIKLDFYRFFKNEKFEDEYDFPHGQLDKKSKRYQTTDWYWLTALREFQEETGLKFINYKIDAFKKVSFVGCDNKPYVQHYFIVHVDEVQRIRQQDKFYTTVLLPLDEARRLLTLQQCIKKDDKHLLI